MFDNKFIITLIALIIGIIAVCNFNRKDSQIIEGLGMLPSFTQVSDISAVNTKTNQFVSHPNFQAQLAPRFFAGAYGGNITYNLPAKKNLAVPDSPLQGGGCNVVNSVIEGYLPVSGCNQGSPTVAPPTDSSSGNYSELNAGSIPDITNILPVGSMEVAGTDGDIQNVVVFNQLMTSTRNSRNIAQGDFIRGDLVACCATGKDAAWVPSVGKTANIALNKGAMFVLGGMDNSTTNKLAVLNNNSIGSSVVSGVDLSRDELASLGAGQTDVSVVGFV